MINNEILSAVIQANCSDHQEHDEDNLCDLCKIKRSIYDNKDLKELACNISTTFIVEAWPIMNSVIESLIVGFILGKQYAESVQLNEKYDEKAHS
jgi:hypothetical protein